MDTSFNELTRLSINILRAAETRQTNETEEAFEMGKHVIIHSRPYSSSTCSYCVEKGTG